MLCPAGGVDAHQEVAGVSVGRVTSRRRQFHVPAFVVVNGNHGVEMRWRKDVIHPGKNAVIAARLGGHIHPEVHADHDLFAGLQWLRQRHN